MTTELQVRPFVQADFSTLMGWFPDEAALVQWGGPEVSFPLDAAQLDRMSAESLRSPPGRALWTGWLGEQRVAHAQVALDWRHGVARLGRVCLSPGHRGLGLAVPFLERVIGQVFAAPVFERLELNVYTFNDAAIRTYLKLGFRQEGVRPSAVKVGTDRWDTAVFGMLRAERPGASGP